tara:strand:- start:592 stop:1227 length:636 start_codon:yes stop_codon:yes gene_type:complete
MKWKDIKKLIKEELNETEIKAGDNKFNLRMGVNRNKTKLGIKIQFEETGTPLTPDMKDKLEVALQERLNQGLAPYKMIANVDTDVPYRDRMDGSRIKPIAFFIPLSQLRSLVVESLGQGEAKAPSAPEAPEPTGSEDGFETAGKDEMDEMINEELINEMRIRELNEISKVVRKEDFYDFINKGNNILRSLEDAGITNGKKYLAYLVKHNIM